MKKSETEQILEYLKHIDESINGPRPKAPPPKHKRPLSDRMDSVEKKVDSLDTKADRLDKTFVALDTKVDRLDKTFVALDTKVDRLDKTFVALDMKVDRLDKTFVALDTKVDRLDTRVSEVQLGLATLAANTKAGFDKVNKRSDGVDQRFDNVDRNIDTTRVQLVDLVTRVHDEVTGRIVDLEPRGPAGRGGGRNSGGSGVPLAS